MRSIQRPLLDSFGVIIPHKQEPYISAARHTGKPGRMGAAHGFLVGANYSG